jgi:hypothetical protein
VTSGAHASADRAREWRQFRLLSRDSVHRLLDRVTLSRDTDPMQFAIWALALAMTPALLQGVRQSMKFPFLMRAAPEVVERALIADRLFFVIYGMLATALLAALAWEALFPDRDDQEIVGVLPVRPRTLAAARLTAAAGIGVVFSAAINLPPALIFSAGSSPHPLVGPFPLVVLGHAVATTLASSWVFFALMTLRGLMAICGGDRLADRLGVLLQLVTIVLLVEVFMFLPGVLPTLVTALQEGGTAHLLLPPLWFVAIFTWIAEGEGLLAPYAFAGLAATAASFALVLLVSLVPAAWMGRRALQVRARERAAALAWVARAIARVVVRRPATRAIFLFAAASLSRSRRHAPILAGYAGLAIAVATVSLITATHRGTLVLDEPRAYMLRLPLLFMFFAIFALRSSLRVPTELDANWPFRMAQPSVAAAVSASRLVVICFAVVPITAAWLAVTTPLWGVGVALRLAAFDFVSGVALVELALARWTTIPFAAAHEAAAETLRSKWLWYVVALYWFSFKLSQVQLAAMQTTRSTVVYIAIACAAALVVRLWARRTARREQPRFDAAPADTVAALNLSEAL